jgi:hypothetical protein
MDGIDSLAAGLTAKVGGNKEPNKKPGNAAITATTPEIANVDTVTLSGNYSDTTEKIMDVMTKINDGVNSVVNTVNGIGEATFAATVDTIGNIWNGISRSLRGPSTATYFREGFLKNYPKR